MVHSATEEIVLLDLNTVSWMYRAIKTTPKNFDLPKERAALLSLAKLSTPVVRFRYPERLVMDPQGNTTEYYRDILPQLIKDFPNLTLSIWHEIGIFRTERAWFEDMLKNAGEKQDDLELLSIAAFFEQKRIKRIATFDSHFINRVPSIRDKIIKNQDLNRWVTRNRADFFSIEARLPSQLLIEYQTQSKS